ncbi:hypothetical protein D3C87_1121500 [compost metagenome]
MESRGAIDGAEVHAFPVNEGNYVVDVAGVAPASVATTLSLARRVAALCAATISASSASLLTARRRVTAVSEISTSGTAFLARSVASQASISIKASGATKLVRRVTASSATTIVVTGSALLAWRYLHRASISRIMRTQPVRAFVVAPELRRFIVPRDSSVMRLPRERGVMP